MKHFTTIALEQIETTIDDMTPEQFPRVIERLLKGGARDAWITPVIMKHGRPGQCLSVLCDAEHADSIKLTIFEETTSIGLRQFTVSRSELSREFIDVETAFGTVRVKVARDLTGRILNAKPELADCTRLANESQVPLKKVIAAADAATYPRLTS